MGIVNITFRVNTTFVLKFSWMGEKNGVYDFFWDISPAANLKYRDWSSNTLWCYCTLATISWRINLNIRWQINKERTSIGLLSGPADSAFANGPGDRGSMSGRVISKTQKMVLDASLLNTQHYNVWIKGKVEKSPERNRAFPYTSV